MKPGRKISKAISIVLVLAMIFSMVPNSLFIKDVQAATMSAGDDLVSSDPGLGTSSNWTTSNMAVAQSGTIGSSSYSTHCKDNSFWGTSGMTGYVYWNTQTTFPAGTYTISILASGTAVTVYPYLNGQVTGTSATVSADDWNSATTVTMTFTVDSDTTGYMGVYAVSTSTSAWINFTDISITCVSVTSSGSDDTGDTGETVETSGTVDLGTAELDMETETTETVEWASGNVPGTFESGTLSTSTPSSNGFFASSTSYVSRVTTYANNGTYSARMQLTSSSSTLYYGASTSATTTYSSLNSATLSSSTTFTEYTYTFTATATTMYLHFATPAATSGGGSNQSTTYAYLRATMTGLTSGTTYTVSFYRTGYASSGSGMNATRYVYIDDVVVTATSTVTVSGTYNISRDGVSDITVNVGDEVPTFPSTINVYATNVDDDTDVNTIEVDVTWDTDSVDTSTVGSYDVTGTFTFNNELYEISAKVYVLPYANIISSDAESDFDSISEEQSDDDGNTWYETDSWTNYSTNDDWIGELGLKTNDWSGVTSDYGVLLNWYWGSDPDGEIIYSVYNGYERYLAPGEYTLTFDAVGTGANIGCYFDGKFYDSVSVTSSTSMNSYSVSFTVEEPILQTLVGIYIEGTASGSWGWLDNINISGYQFDENDADEIASFEDMFLVTSGYNYVDLEVDEDENPVTTTTYNYSFTKENETDNSILSTGGFFEDEDKTYLEWRLGSGWWSDALSSNSWADNVPADWESGYTSTWISNTLSADDLLTYTVPILPAGTYTLYYSVMGQNGMVYPYIGGSAETDGHALALWDKYQYYSYTFTVDSIQYDYEIGMYYALDANGYAYTDCVYLLGTEEITDEMRESYQVYKESKVASSVTYDSGSVGSYNYQAVADAGTYDLNQYFTGTSSDDGKVFTDKSVTLAEFDFDGDSVVDLAEPDDTEFNVALSALSQSYSAALTQISVTGGTVTGESGAVDIVFVLDISMSMIYQDGYLYDTKLVPMIDAVNEAIDTVFEQNEENRVAVVGYTSDSDTVTLIDLTDQSGIEEVTSTTLSGTTYTYENTGSEHTYIGYTINTASQERDVTATIGGMSDSCLMDTFGTYMQKGISYAGEILQDATATDTARTPFVFILTDGEADYYSTDYTAAPISGTTNSSASVSATTGYYTILTANYWKNTIAAYYTEMNGVDTEAYFYTVGFDITDSSYPEYVNGLLDPSTLSSATGSIATSLLSMLESSSEDCIADGYDYVTEFTTALDMDELKEVIADFASTATSATTTMTTVDTEKSAVNSGSTGAYSALSSELVFTDYVGTQMQVTSVPYVCYQGTLYYPSLDPNDTTHQRPVETGSGTDENDADYTYTRYLYYAQVNPDSATEEAAEDDPNISDLTVEIRTYESGEQCVYFAVPSYLVPTCSYDSDTSVFTESLPIRLIFRVGLVIDENIVSDQAYYTNKYSQVSGSDSRLQAETTSTFVPSTSNPYYYETEDWVVTAEDDTKSYVTDTYIDYEDTTGEEFTGLVLKKASGSTYVPKTIKKYTNATKTSSYSYYAEKEEGTATATGYTKDSTGTDDLYEGTVYYMTLTAQLGNNGKIVLKEQETAAEYYVWLGHTATLEVGANLDEDYVEYYITGSELESTDDTEAEGTDYTYTLSGEAEELILEYTNNQSIGDYVYALNAPTGETTYITIHVYNVTNDLYVLDYGLGVSLADITYNNGLFQNDELTTSGSDTDATYGGVKFNSDEAAVAEDEDGTVTEDTEYTAEAVGTYGTVSGPAEQDIDTTDNSVDTDIIYTPTKFMSDIDSFEYKVLVMDTSATVPSEYNNSVTMHQTIEVMPATSVYYEDNFASSGSDNTDPEAGFIISGNFSTSTDSSGASSTLQNNSLETQYGYDEAYDDDRLYSNGSATLLDAPESITDPAVTFQFKGTGFSVYTRCTSASATLMAMVYDATSGDYVTNSIVNTFYQNGTLYQIPALNVTNLDYGDYKVVLYVIATDEQTKVIFDGVRIYNPAGTNTDVTENYIDNEVDADYNEVRNLILGKGFTTRAVTTEDDDGNETTTNELIPGSGRAATFMSFDADDNSVTVDTGTLVETYTGIADGTQGTATDTSDNYDYLVSGPNNETYLAANEGVAITLNAYDNTDNENADNDYTFQVQAKGVKGTTSSSAVMSAYVLDYDEAGNLIVTETESYTLTTSSGMYYKITMPESASDECTVLLMNTGDNTLSISNIKSKGYTYLTSDNEEFGEEIDYLGKVTNTICDYLAYAEKLNVVGDPSTDYDEQDTENAEGTEELANTVKAQVSPVTDGTFSLRFIGTVDGLEYNDVGFLITLYDENGDVLKAENAKTVTTVYTYIVAGGETITPDEGSYFYTYTYRNIPSDATYYFRVANYTNYESKILTSSYKYYKVSNGEVSVVDSIGGDSNE